MKYVLLLLAMLLPAHTAAAMPLPPRKPVAEVPLPPKKPASIKKEESVAPKVTLKGTRAAVVAAHEVAKRHDLTPVRDAAQAERFAKRGILVEVKESDHVALHDVGYPYARPALALFIERLGAQYYGACKERLVVTSLVRPQDEQPWNASDYSVHPHGIAVDFRVPNAACRAWLEKTLLTLEERGVIDATRERRPPHYHVVVFPHYTAYAKAR